MGDPSYDARRATERQEADDRAKQEAVATEAVSLLLGAVKGFFSGQSCLVVETIGDQTYIRYQA